MSESRSMSKLHLKWIFAFIYIVVLLFVIEGISYVVVVGSDNSLGDRSQRHLFSAIRGHELNPDYRRPFDTGNVKIHSDQGFRRDRLIEKEKPAGTFRIFAMGGSTLYGLGVQRSAIYPEHRTLLNNETITYFLERELNERLRRDGVDIDVEIINAGVTAYHTFQHVLYFYETLYEYDPDMLIFLDGHNDFYRMSEENQIKNYTYSSMEMIRSLNRRDPFLSLYLGVRFLGNYSYFFKLVEKASWIAHEKFEARSYQLFTHRGEIGQDFPEQLEASARASFIRNYKLIEAFGKYYNFSYQVFLQPEVVFEDGRLLNEHDAAVKRSTEEAYGVQTTAMMKEARSLFPALFAKYDIPFVELGDIGSTESKDEALYLDYCHLTPKGSKTVAERMLPVVLEQVEKQIRDHSRAVASNPGPLQVPERAVGAPDDGVSAPRSPRAAELIGAR
ncbi:MAG: SGNH/GDSL hydrolase family protein [Geminicoccaceae bacterium]